MAFGSALWAHALAGSGVGTAAAALADAPGADDAGAAADPAGDAPVPPVGALDDVVELQAANSKIAMNARAGNLKRLLIPCSSSVEPHRAAAIRTAADARLAVHYHDRKRVCAIVCNASFLTF